MDCAINLEKVIYLYANCIYIHIYILYASNIFGRLKTYLSWVEIDFISFWRQIDWKNTAKNKDLPQFLVKNHAATTGASLECTLIELHNFSSSSTGPCRFCCTKAMWLYLGVSKNNGTLKSSILIGFSSINHPFWGTPIFGNTHLVKVNIHEQTNSLRRRLTSWADFFLPWNVLKITRCHSNNHTYLSCCWSRQETPKVYQRLFIAKAVKGWFDHPLNEYSRWHHPITSGFGRVIMAKWPQHLLVVWWVGYCL